MHRYCLITPRPLDVLVFVLACTLPVGFLATSADAASVSTLEQAQKVFARAELDPAGDAGNIIQENETIIDNPVNGQTYTTAVQAVSPTAADDRTDAFASIGVQTQFNGNDFSLQGVASALLNANPATGSIAAGSSSSFYSITLLLDEAYDISLTADFTEINGDANWVLEGFGIVEQSDFLEENSVPAVAQFATTNRVQPGTYEFIASASIASTPSFDGDDASTFAFNLQGTPAGDNPLPDIPDVDPGDPTAIPTPSALSAGVLALLALWTLNPRRRHA